MSLGNVFESESCGAAASASDMTIQGDGLYLLFSCSGSKLLQFNLTLNEFTAVYYYTDAELVSFAKGQVYYYDPSIESTEFFYMILSGNQAGKSTKVYAYAGNKLVLIPLEYRLLRHNEILHLRRNLHNDRNHRWKL